MRRVALGAIRFYQYTLSPDHGPLRHILFFGCCRFRPTCSEYAYQAINKYGLVKGCALSTWRIVRCNPWNPGGNDPVK